MFGFGVMQYIFPAKTPGIMLEQYDISGVLNVPHFGHCHSSQQSIFLFRVFSPSILFLVGYGRAKNP